MSFKRIEDGEKYDPVRPCLHPEHNPPMHIVLGPGTYEWACPNCGRKQTVVVNRGARWMSAGE